MHAIPNETADAARQSWYRQPDAQVLIALALGAVPGHFEPVIAGPLKPLGRA